MTLLSRTRHLVTRSFPAAMTCGVALVIALPLAVADPGGPKSRGAGPSGGTPITVPTYSPSIGLGGGAMVHRIDPRDANQDARRPGFAPAPVTGLVTVVPPPATLPGEAALKSLRHYYCPDLQMYYPRVVTCPSPWVQVNALGHR